MMNSRANLIKPILVTSGEPAGIGPELCSFLTALNAPIVVLGDKYLLAERAQILNQPIHWDDYQPRDDWRTWEHKPGHLMVWHLPCSGSRVVTAGQLDTQHVPYVLTMLKMASESCFKQEFSALVTAPVHKGIINQAGIVFTGHTEYFAEQCGVTEIVMMLVCDAMRVALVTTHVALKDVSRYITSEKIQSVVRLVNQSLKLYFNKSVPKIAVAGLNPHAGEGGYLGTEELDVINPSIDLLKQQGIHITGALSADTLFTAKNLQDYDAFITMYHDQGLPVLKYASFGHAVNVTLGLPYIRTSVDHGTALELAGTGKASAESLICAVNLAIQMVQACQIKLR